MNAQRRHLLTGIAWLLAGGLLAGACASTPAAPEPTTQSLIDEFIRVMPRDPRELREPEVRASLAPAALPAMQRIRAHVAAHADSGLADRVHEFVVFSLVLDEPGLRSDLQARAAAGERGAALLLRSADVIQAASAVRRRAAVDALANALANGGSERGATEAACAVQCVVVAGDLAADEARQLAAYASEPLAGRLRGVAEQRERDPRRLLDQPFAISGTQFDGSPFDSRSLLGKVVLLDFWATWCTPCVRALPDLVEVQQQHRDGLAIVGISCDDDREQLTRFLAEHRDVNWTQLFADDGKRWHPLATQYGVPSIPRLFLIDRNGVLRSVDARSQLDALVRRYLAE